MIKSSIYPINHNRSKRSHHFITHIPFPENHYTNSNQWKKQLNFKQKNNPTQKNKSSKSKLHYTPKDLNFNKFLQTLKRKLKNKQKVKVVLFSTQNKKEKKTTQKSKRQA